MGTPADDIGVSRRPTDRKKRRTPSKANIHHLLSVYLSLIGEIRLGANNHDGYLAGPMNEGLERNKEDSLCRHLSALIFVLVVPRFLSGWPDPSN